MRNKVNAITGLVFAVLFAAAGVFAYSSNYYIVLWGFLPLSGTAFFIIAVILFVVAIVGLVRAPKQDQQAEQSLQAHVMSIAQQQAQQQGPMGMGATVRTQLAAPCTVIITHTRGALGWGNKFAVVMNGSPVGEIKNKGSLRVGTFVAENTVAVVRSDNRATATVNFMAAPNSTVTLRIVINMSAHVRIEQV